MLKCVDICDRGLKREINQDRTGHFFTGDKGLFLVSDGMGGHFSGEKASEAILCAFSAWWDDYFTAPQRPPLSQVLDQLRDVIQKVNCEIRDFTPPQQLCGATLVALFLSGQEFALLSSGDSRCYRIRRRGPLPSIEQLTGDDVVRGSQNRRQNGRLLQAVGITPRCPVSVQTGEVRPNTTFALCSDGIYKYCPESAWKWSLRRIAFGAGLQETGVQIVQAVRARGAPDNYSLVLVKTE